MFLNKLDSLPHGNNTTKLSGGFIGIIVVTIRISVGKFETLKLLSLPSVNIK